MSRDRTNHSPKLDRRTFLKGASAAVAAPMIITGCATSGGGRRLGANDRVNIGCIGVGNQGINDMRGALNDDRAQVVAVCDVNRASKGYWLNREGGRDIAKQVAEGHYAEKAGAATYSGVDTYTDYRELLARGDIDAVILALPDHWHALPVVEAAAAGKDIYGEKPLSLTVIEGRIMSDAVNKHRRIFQTGSQQRSDNRFRHACELVRNGYIGELHTVRCGLPGGFGNISQQGHRIEPEPVPDGFDYEFWLGPAPDAPYIPATSHVDWRWNFDYSGGQLTDWGGHHPDIAQWGMGTEHTGPVRIQNPNVKYADHPIFNTAVEYYFECIYDTGVMLIVSDGERSGVTFEGSEGSVWVNRGGIEANPESLLKQRMGQNDIHLTRSTNHMRNFINCIYSREQTIAPIENAHRSITIAHLGNIAMKLNRDLEWDPKKERFTDDTANQFLHRPYRSPWSLKGLPNRGKSLSEA